jgi:uncharacterized membrane protein
MNRTNIGSSIDLVTIGLLSVINLLVYLIAGNNVISDLISLLFLGFFPGYLIIELIPASDKIDRIERLMMSVVLSLVIGGTAYILTVNFFDRSTLVVSAYGAILLTEALILIVLYRRLKLGVAQNPNSWVNFFSSARSEIKSMRKGKKVMMLASVFIVIAILAASIGMLATVKKQNYSEFYILNEDGHAYNIPHNFTVGAQKQIILGIENHEDRTVKYYVEVWLVNYTIANGGVTVKHMYACQSMNVTLDSTAVDINGVWVPQYEIMLNLNFSISGDYYLYFMLFKDNPEPFPLSPFNPSIDYNTDPHATWRVVEAVNNQIQYLRLNVNISP